MTHYTIARSRTGSIHIVSRGSYNATPCNSRNRGFAVSRIAADSARSASEAAYCRKCFPNGKPADDRIAELCAKD